MSQFRLRPPFAHWIYTEGALLRADAVRVTVNVCLFDEEVPCDEEGDPEGYAPEWLVQFPTPSGGAPGHVNYATTTTFPWTCSMAGVLRDVDAQWPMGPRP